MINKITKKDIQTFVLIAFLISLSAFSFRKLPDTQPYPPMLSKKFPLSTPVSFWATMLGMRRLAADILWIQTIQYYGAREKSSILELTTSTKSKKLSNYPQLKDHWTQIIRFDPFFVNAYLIGPTTLAWNLKRHNEAMVLIDESIESVIQAESVLNELDLYEIDEVHPLITGTGQYFTRLKWKLYTLKSALVFFHAEKFKEAVPLLEALVYRDKNTPEEIKVMLAQVYEERQEYKKAMRLWLIIYESTYKESRKVKAYNNLVELKGIIESKSR